MRSILESLGGTHSVAICVICVKKAHGMPSEVSFAIVIAWDEGPLFVMLVYDVD